MDPAQFRSIYGSEYPDAVTLQGVRMALEREGRFIRVYSNRELRSGTEISRFQDGSAQIGLAQLEAEWATWPGRDKMDFCKSCSWLKGNPDLPAILRHLMREGDCDHWSSIAWSVAEQLPKEEAFTNLAGALLRLTGGTANITQAIARTRHRDAKRVLRSHLDILWGSADLWLDDPFLNWRAFDATCCISHLLEVGAKRGDLESKVRKLSKHACKANRESCSKFLHEHYRWIPRQINA